MTTSSSSTISKKNLTIFQPRSSFIDDDEKKELIEFSAHQLSKRMKREVKYVFPKQNINELIMIATFQQSRNDLVKVFCLKTKNEMKFLKINILPVCYYFTLYKRFQLVKKLKKKKRKN